MSKTYEPALEHEQLSTTDPVAAVAAEVQQQRLARHMLKPSVMCVHFGTPSGRFGTNRTEFEAVAERPQLTTVARSPLRGDETSVARCAWRSGTMRKVEAESDASVDALTLRAVLRLDIVRDAGPVVAAGHHRLDHAIRWVRSGEVPAVTTLLRSHELLLTTGMGITGAEAQGKFISRLAQADAAA